MEFFTLFIMILFVSVIQIVVPFFVKRTVVFGVTIPYEQTKHPKVMQYKKGYAILTSIAALFVTVGFIIANQAPNIEETMLVLIGSIMPIFVLMIGFTLYFYFHFKMTKLKKTQKWFGEVKQVRIADLNIRSKDEMLASFVYLIPVVITAALFILTINLFDQLPNQIPTHWGPDGKADAFTDKSWMSVLNLPLVLLVLQLMFFSINLFTKRSGIKISAGNVSSSTLRQLCLRKYSSWYLFVTNILMTLLFSFLQLNLLYENLFTESIMLLLPLGFLLILLAGVLVLAVKVGSVDSDFAGKIIVDETNTNKVESVDEDQYWKGGLFYFNKNDPSIFVEKRFGVGWTLNFANPIGYLVIILPIIILLFISFSM